MRKVSSRKDTKKVYTSKTLITMVLAVVYAVAEQLTHSNGADGNFSWSEVNWPMLITAVIAIVMRFFNDQKLTL